MRRGGLAHYVIVALAAAGGSYLVAHLASMTTHLEPSSVSLLAGDGVVIVVGMFFVRGMHRVDRRMGHMATREDIEEVKERVAELLALHAGTRERVEGNERILANLVDQVEIQRLELSTVDRRDADSRHMVIGTVEKIVAPLQLDVLRIEDRFNGHIEGGKA